MCIGCHKLKSFIVFDHAPISLFAFLDLVVFDKVSTAIRITADMLK